MNARTLKGLMSAIGIFVSVGAQAAIVPWTATINQAQEVPASGSLATGSAFGTLDDVSGLLSWNIMFAGLTGPATAMHFHGPAGAGVNAGVQVNVGSISGLNSPSNGSATISGVQIAQFTADNWYLNIHTQAFPGGEIRGQVLTTAAPVPEPATLALVGLALVGVAATRRNKAR